MDADTTRSPDKSAVTSTSTIIPPSRIRNIMRSGPDQVTVSSEALYVMTRAAELFVEHLAREAAKGAPEGCDELTYAHLASQVQQNEQLEFLHEIIPKKVRYGDVLAALNNNAKNNENS